MHLWPYRFHLEMARKETPLRVPPIVELQNYCCCSCQIPASPELLQSEGDDDRRTNERFASRWYSASSAARHAPKTGESLPRPRRRKRRLDWLRGFLRNTWLFLMISFLIFPASETHSVAFTPDERRLVRGLFLKKFGLEQLVAEERPMDTPIPEYLWELYR